MASKITTTYLKALFVKVPKIKYMTEEVTKFNYETFLGKDNGVSGIVLEAFADRLEKEHIKLKDDEFEFKKTLIRYFMASPPVPLPPGTTKPKIESQQPTKEEEDTKSDNISRPKPHKFTFKSIERSVLSDIYATGSKFLYDGAIKNHVLPVNKLMEITTNHIRLDDSKIFSFQNKVGIYHHVINKIVAPPCNLMNSIFNKPSIRLTIELSRSQNTKGGSFKVTSPEILVKKWGNNHLIGLIEYNLPTDLTLKAIENLPSTKKVLSQMLYAKAPWGFVSDGTTSFVLHLHKNEKKKNPTYTVSVVSFPAEEKEFTLPGMITSLYTTSKDKMVTADGIKYY